MSPSGPHTTSSNRDSRGFWDQIMAYGSGKPSWARGDVEEGGLNRRSNAISAGAGGSYQRGDGGYNYQPPQLTGTYAEQQTQVMEDTLRTHVQVSLKVFSSCVDFIVRIIFSMVYSTLKSKFTPHRQRPLPTTSLLPSMPNVNNFKMRMRTLGRCEQMWRMPNES